MPKLEKSDIPQPNVSNGEASKTTAVVPTQNMVRFTRKPSQLGLRGDIAVHAPPAYGKTFLAASVSAKWPGEALGQLTVEIDDILWVAVDVGACDGLLASRIDVKHYIDARDIIEEYGVVDGVRRIHDLTSEMVRANDQIRFVVYDTVSELDKLWQSQLESEGGDGDGRWVFRQLLSKHRTFHGASHRACGSAKPIYLAHSAALADFNDKTPDSQRAQRKATKLPGGAEIKLDITGKGHDIYINNASLVLTIVLEEQKGKEVKRYVASGETGFETKNRLQGLVGKREPFGLGPICARMESHIAVVVAELRAAESARNGG